VPWKVITAIVSAVLYFISPLDVICDFIPILGYLDDAAVVGLALKFCEGDLKQYEEWKKKKDATEV